MSGKERLSRKVWRAERFRQAANPNLVFREEPEDSKYDSHILREHWKRVNEGLLWIDAYKGSLCELKNYLEYLIREKEQSK